MQTIAIVNQKGGVGKSTTAVNLGAGLTRQGKRVLLIDADSQANLTEMLGWQQPDELSPTLATMLERIISDRPIEPQNGILHHKEGMDLLPANIELSGLEVSLVNTMSRETVLRTYLNEVKRQYDYILVDCSPSLGMLTLNALTAADRVIIPVQSHYLPVKGLEQLKSKLRSGNKAFDVILSDYVDYATDYYAIIFLHTPREKHPEKSMRPEYYSHIVSARKYTDDKVLQFPEGIKMLISYTSFAYNEDGKKYDVESYTDDCLSYLGNDRLKGEYVVNNSFRSFKSYDQYLNAMEKFGKYLVTPSLKMRAEAVGTKLYDTKAGGQAADFTYPDVDGKMVSLSDFKGKVVLVDVWATWCGPCRQQIPYLKKLEEEMHGTDVVFGGVSVDESKDKQKWLDFIKTEGLKGVQLLAGGWSKITKDYKITGIPRFMVFDKKGNIVSVDAPRPSSPELKKMLENEESRLKQIT